MVDVVTGKEEDDYAEKKMMTMKMQKILKWNDFINELI